LSSAAILAVYAAGYERTNPAAERIEAQAEHRRYIAPAPAPFPNAKAEAIVPTAVAGLLKPVGPDRSAKAEVQKATDTPTVASVAPVSQLETQSSVPAAVETPAPAATAPESQPVPVATAPAPVSALETASAAPAWRDGVYLGWGYSRHGDIEAFVRIENGYIVAAGIEKCQTRYSCSVINQLPPQVVARQSANVDYVSGATQSADAFYGGIFEALKKAQ